MSGLDLYSIQKSITAYVREQFPNYVVYEDDVINDEMIFRIGNKVKPYIVLRWNAMQRNMANTSFAGTRFDEYNSSVDVCIVAPTGSQCRQGINIIVDKLVGWQPENSSPMTLFGGGGLYVINDNTGSPHVYIATEKLAFNINAQNVGSHITS
jgi:hypothetical protein